MSIDNEDREIFRQILMGGRLDEDGDRNDMMEFIEAMNNSDTKVTHIGVESLDVTGELIVCGLKINADFKMDSWDNWTFVVGILDLPDRKSFASVFPIPIPLDDELIKEFKLRVEMELL